MKYKNIFFDLYGTLCDIKTDETMGVVWRVLADEYTHSGAKYTVEELKKSFYESINAKIEGKDEFFEPDIGLVFKDLYNNKGIVENKSLIAETAKTFRKASTIYLSIYDGVLEGLKSLKKAGRKVFLLSNAQSLFTLPELISLNLTHYFDDIFLSSDYGVKKPSEDFFDIAFKKYGLAKNQSIMVGNDGSADIKGAINYGIDSLYVKTATSPDEAMPSATYIIKNYDFSVITQILLS